jgi:hypothetical protein
VEAGGFQHLHPATRLAQEAYARGLRQELRPAAAAGSRGTCEDDGGGHAGESAGKVGSAGENGELEPAGHTHLAEDRREV